jgi:hypothetical protein
MTPSSARRPGSCPASAKKARYEPRSLDVMKERAVLALRCSRRYAPSAQVKSRIEGGPTHAFCRHRLASRAVTRGDTRRSRPRAALATHHQ